MEEIKKYLNEFKNGTKTMFEEFFNKETNKKQRANMWTFSRLVIAFIIPILSIIGNIIASPIVFSLAFLTTGFGALTDFFDGRSARKYHSNSEYGKLLDQAVDKVFAIMIGISLSLSNPLFLINLFGEGLIASTNIIYKHKYKDININSTKIGKIKQWPLFLSLALGFLSTLIPGMTNIVNISIITTLLFQLAAVNSYVKENKKAIQDLENEKNSNEVNIIETSTEEKENVKVLEKENSSTQNLENEKNNDSINKPIISRKNQLINLRNLLSNIENNIENNEIVDKEEKGLVKQKTKNDFN